jgi:hypothetical protein
MGNRCQFCEAKGHLEYYERRVLMGGHYVLVRIAYHKDCLEKAVARYGEACLEFI